MLTIFTIYMHESRKWLKSCTIAIDPVSYDFVHHGIKSDQQVLTFSIIVDHIKVNFCKLIQYAALIMNNKFLGESS